MRNSIKNIKTIPKVSVVITCFNDAEFLPEAIASVEASVEKNHEIIIVDDGSTTSETLKILNEYQSKGYSIYQQLHQGVSIARNSGIQRASGDYILTLDVDNKIRREYLTKAAYLLDANPQAGVVYSNYQIFGAKNEVKNLPPYEISRLLYSNYIDTCSVFRKKAWEDAGGFPEGIMNELYFEDWDFWLSVAEKKWQFLHIPEVMFDYRKKNLSRTTKAELNADYSQVYRLIYSKHSALVYENYRALFQAMEKANKHPVKHLVKRVLNRS